MIGEVKPAHQRLAGTASRQATKSQRLLRRVNWAKVVALNCWAQFTPRLPW